jgi:hypothetical protein
MILNSLNIKGQLNGTSPTEQGFPKGIYFVEITNQKATTETIKLVLN